jgi:hypothetical protein
VPRELAKGRESEEIECERSRPFLTTFWVGNFVKNLNHIFVELLIIVVLNKIHVN